MSEGGSEGVRIRMGGGVSEGGREGGVSERGREGGKEGSL